MAKRLSTTQLAPTLVAAKANGRRGGLATARKHGPEFCQRRAEKGGNRLLELYGVDYFRHIRKIGTAKRQAARGKKN